MFKSESISKLAVSLLKAQRKMGAASKDAANPFFRSKFADYGAVLEVAKGPLNEEGIVVLQPHSTDGAKSYVETVLVHESGEWVSSQTEVVCAKQNDPQALGSAITYARRYGLQSLLSIPAEDTDGEGAMNRSSTATQAKAATPTVATTTTEAKPSPWRKPKPTTEAKPVDMGMEF